MNTTPFKLAACLTLLALAPAVQAQASVAAAIEKRLGPAVEIAGQPAPTRTLVDAMAGMRVPGVSVALLRGGRLAWARGYGQEDVAGGPITTETLFQAGSISKPIAALSILELASSGKVSLDAPVNDYLKSWKLPDSDVGKARDVTLRRLLAHTGGTNVHGFPGYERGTPVPTLRAILDGATPANTDAVRITSQPGVAWNYSGGGYVVAQLVVAEVTGRSFEEWTTTHWLKPAGMANSRFDAGQGSRLASGHGVDGKRVPGGHHVYPEAAAAGLWTTPTDLAHALIAMRRSIKGERGALLPEATARTVMTPVLPGHAVGFDVGGGESARWIAKGGDTEGFASYLVFYPERGDGAVVMTNGAQGATLARDVMRAIAVEENWPDFGPRTRHATTVPESLLEVLPGTYTYRDTHHFSIERKGDVLTIASPGEQPETLYRDRSGEFFTLSQDVAFVFDESASTGHIQAGANTIAFRKER